MFGRTCVPMIVVNLVVSVGCFILGACCLVKRLHTNLSGLWHIPEAAIDTLFVCE